MDELRKRMVDALLLAQLIPSYMRPPTTVVPEPDGDISFEWYADKSNLISIWIRDGHVSYAGMANSNSLHGRTSERAVIPPACMAVLCMVIEKLRNAPTVNASETQSLK